MQRQDVVVAALAALLIGCFGGLCMARDAAAEQPSASPMPTSPAAPAREFRAAWIATVANIDWPSKKGLSVADLRAEMNRTLDALRAAGFNAAIFQVRPSCDALYRSALEPWSEFLTGEQGKPVPGAPDDYDPLAEWITAAHTRGMELHAWFNPFRARSIKATGADASTHLSRTKPQWVRTYAGELWLDPGDADAREHSMRVVLDIVQRYDIDGVHYDDYFYPYPKPGQPFPDDDTFKRYQTAGGTLDRDAWRRSNIDAFVRDLYQRVHQAKPWVMVTISPFGIYRPGHPPQVRGLDAFAALHADARRWVREGWCDAVCPQLYWKAEAPQQPFARLLDWWIDQNDHRRQIWSGLNASRVLPAPQPGEKPAESWEPSDILKQVDLTRASGGATGIVCFSAKALVENRRGLADRFRDGPFVTPALTPARPWLTPKDSPPLAAPALSLARDGGSLHVVAGSSSDVVLIAMVRRAAANGDVWSLTVGTRSEVRISDYAAAGATHIACAWRDRYGNLGPWSIIELKP